MSALRTFWLTRTSLRHLPGLAEIFHRQHRSLPFVAAVALLLNDKRMGIPAMVIAVLVTFSRLYLYVHYPTDVIFSIIVGTAFAFIGNALAGKIADRFPAPAKGKYES